MKRIIIYLLLIIPALNFAQGSGSSLNFDGTNDMVDLPASITQGFTTNFSIQFWFKPKSNNYDRIISKYIGNGTGDSGDFIIDTYSPTNNGRGLRFWMSNGTLNSVIDIDNVTTLNTWNHVTVTFDNGEMKIFVNGSMVINGSSTFSALPISSVKTVIGEDRISSYAEFFNGNIDELSFWTTTLSESEIKSWMCKKITSSHPNYANLVAYYNADSGSGSTLVDQSSNTNNGTLVNSPTWQTSSAPLGDENIYLTTVSNGSSLNLVHSDGSDLTVNVTGGTAESLFIYNVNEEPNVTTLPLGLDQLSQTNYWGIKSFGSSSLVYEVVYNYDGHSGISDESNLRLCSRADNATLSWAEESATLNTTTNTLTLGGQTGTEFILGSVGGNTLPVNEFELKDYTFFPNPTSDFLKLTEGDFIDNYYQIFDIRGGKILEGKIKFENKIDVRNLSEGLYFLKFENSESYRFIKNK